eukprot:TRINITY_DN2519_c0_g6_i1.p2 TRINITY_DN2519_c0_g6~~TRINITY_DN2519_c0_g6_i1.p2  ORF type:complete len:134 (-),score=2.13 TRINITY_DN2519_c0_g6_i1:651-1052(-)
MFRDQLERSQVPLNEDPSSPFAKMPAPLMAEIIEIVRHKSLTSRKSKTRSLEKQPSRSKFESTARVSKKGRRKWTLLKNTLSAVTKFRVPVIYNINNPVLSPKQRIERCDKGYGGVQEHTCKHRQQVGILLPK